MAYLEGDFNPYVAFYPRGPKDTCPQPPKSFSILSASGFSMTPENLASIAKGEFPPEESCDTAPIDDTIVIALQEDPAKRAELSQLACTTNDSGGQTYYNLPPEKDPRGTDQAWACASFPRLSNDDAGVASGEQLVVASAPNQPCRGTQHYFLRGCNNDPACTTGAGPISLPTKWAWPCKIPQ